MKYVFYGCDTETTGLDHIKNDIIEISLYRLSDDIQKTWLIKPININNIEIDALRINGHLLEDLKGETKHGRDAYQDANKVIIEIENWLSEDDAITANRVLIGHNINFDKNMIEQLWFKCNASDSFPFGRRVLDTMQIALMMDFAQNNFDEAYSLKNLAKKHGVINAKAHSAESDTKCTVDIFRKQAEILRKALNENIICSIKS